jgi:uncharacterized membrane protein (UPF0127 family)
MTRLCIILLAAVAGLCVACKKEKVPQVEPLFNKVPGEPTAALPRLQSIKVWVGSEELIAELALTPIQVRTGMMFRTNMAENEAMLFVDSAPRRASFWMKNVDIPLSAAFIDPEGVILEIRKLEPHNTNSVVAASSRIQFVMETPRGWFERHNVSTGAVVRTEHGTMKETFSFHR